jgi:hypothetical protein
MVNVQLGLANATLTTVALIVIHGLVSPRKIVTMESAEGERVSASATLVILEINAMLVARLDEIVQLLRDKRRRHSKQRLKCYVHNNLINHLKHA